MSIIKRRLNYNDSGDVKILHLETSSDMVLRGDGTDAEAALLAAEASITNLQTALAQVDAAIAVLKGVGDGSISKAVADGIATIVADAPESLDTMKELSDWIINHDSDAASMNSSIQSNAAAIAALQSGSVHAKAIAFTASDFVNNVFTIPAATHGMSSSDFLFKLYMQNGATYQSNAWCITEAQVTYNADKSITITATGGFAGKIVLVG